MNFPQESKNQTKRQLGLAAVIWFGINGLLAVGLAEPVHAAAAGQNSGSTAQSKKTHKPHKPMTPAQYQQQWGPVVGAKIEPLAAKDQQGEVRELADLAGPNGLLLFLVRSADW